jgi:Fur family transcriptional regulator, zinc uptake regulator
MNDQITLSGHQRSVLDALQRAAGPQSAYALLEAVADSGIRAPVQVYRALGKLVAAGLVHKVESLNAFVACADHEKGHWAAFTICEKCGAVGEVPVGDPGRLVSDLELGTFDAHSAQLELRGLCGDCRDRKPA